MKYVTGIAAWLLAVVGAIALVGGIAAKDGESIGVGAGLLVSTLIVGVMCSGLTLLEGIREDLRTAARGIQKDLRQAETTPR
jgi:hypothetical protein